MTRSRLSAKARPVQLACLGYTTIVRSDLSGYVSIAAPVLDWNGDLRFTLSLAGTRASMTTEPTSEQVKSLLTSASRATHALGGKAGSAD